MGDTGGIERDKRNVMNILAHISRLEKLNGICILLKSNNARLTASFQYCISELLKNLHKDACRNIVFCFTDSRSSHYEPGDSSSTLRAFPGNDNIDIRLNDETIYCVDNEAVRYLAAVKAGVLIKGDKRERFASESWNISARKKIQILEHIASIDPHAVQDSLSVNDTRRMIQCVAEPLAEMKINIEQTLVDIKSLEDKLTRAEADKVKLQLANNLYIPSCETIAVPLETIQVVCTSDKCTSKVAEGNEIRTEFLCSREIFSAEPWRIPSFVASFFTPVVRLMYEFGKKRTALSRYLASIAQDRKNTKCDHDDKSRCDVCKFNNCELCKCELNLHTCISQQVVHYKLQKLNLTLRQEITDVEMAASKIKTHLELLKEETRDLRSEHEQILDAVEQFVRFLTANAIVPLKDTVRAFNEYSTSVDERDAAARQRRVKIHDEVRHVAWLVDALSSSNASETPPSPTGIKALIERLKLMPKVGKMIKDVAAVGEVAMMGNVKKREVVVNLRPAPESDTPAIFKKLKAIYSAKNNCPL